MEQIYGKLEELVLLNIMRDDKLLPLQFAVKEKLNKNKYVFVLDEVGCGKTVEAGICIWDTILQGGKNVLIVAPANLTFNWYAEMLTKFGLDFKVIAGTKDYVDLYCKREDCTYNYHDYETYKKNISEEITNLCIVSYDSRNKENSNAALDRISKMNMKWDLMILDEGHESKNDASIRYKTLMNYSSKKVLFLSATPIKNIQEDFVNEFALVKTIIEKGNPQLEIENLVLDPVRAISFDLYYPISRNFKEIIMDAGAFKQRIVSAIDYEICDEIIKCLPGDGIDFDQKRNCIMLFENYLRKNKPDIFVIYHKTRYDKNDVQKLRIFDNKLDALLKKIDEIRDVENGKADRMVVFCNHIAVINYLKKVFACLYGEDAIEAMHGESHEQEERKKRLLLLDKEDTEMDKKWLVILSHNVASVGVNLSKFTHLINYELPYTPADLEQRFGRIDRLTNNSDKLMLYFFKDENGYFDSVYLNRIFMKLTWEVLPMLPSKNLINTVTDTVIEGYAVIFERLQKIEEYLEELSKLEEQSTDKIKENETILKEIKELFEKKVLETESGKVLQKNVEDILEKIKMLKEQWKVNKNYENIRNTIENQLREMQNKVFYNQNFKVESIGYEELEQLVYSDENSESTKSSKYRIYQGEIESLKEDVLAKADMITLQYKQDKKEFWKNIRTYLEGRDNMAFMTIYGIYCALRKTDSTIRFVQIMGEYNGGI